MIEHGGRILAFGLIGVSAIVCLPFAVIGTLYFAHAPNNWVVLIPWLALLGTWFLVWLMLKRGLWMPACLLLAIPIGFFANGWVHFDVP
jgi:hypothetical protein